MSLVCWLPLQGNLNNQGIDNIATITATNASYETTGKIGQCIKLGYSSNFTIPSLVRAKQISIAYWVRINTATSTQWLDPIHYYSNTPDGTGSGWVTRQEFYSNCTLTGFWFDNGSVSGIGVTVGEWTHFAITVDYNAGVAKMYKNGELVKTANTVNTNAYVTGDNFRIGENGLDLSECDVRIYNHILNAKEVAEIAKGLVLHYPLSDPYVEATTNYVSNQTMSAGSIGGWGGHSTQRTVEDATSYPIPCDTCNKLAVTYSGSGSGGSGMWIQTVNCSPSTVYTYSCYIKTPDSLGPLNANILYRYEYDSSGTKLTEVGCWTTANSIKLTDGWYRIYGTFTTNASAATFGVYSYVYPNKTCDYYIGCWQVEQKDHLTPYVLGSRSETTVCDTSGYCRNGTAYSITCTSDTPRNSIGYQVTPGAGVFGRLNMTFSQYTISFWGKHSTKAKMLFGSNASPSSTNTNWYWYGDKSFKYPSGEYYYTYNAGSEDALLGKWTHFVATYDGTNVYVYRNGVPEGSKAATGNMVLDYVSVGNGYSSSSYWENGAISDLRIYATCLTADQVKQLYDTPVSLANNSTLLTQGEFIEQ